MKEICETLKKRFLLMEKIAAYKFIHNLPLCDSEREKWMKITLETKANEMQLSVDGVLIFWDVLMDLAKKVQSNILCRYFYDEKFYAGAITNIADVRKEIEELDDMLLKNIANFYEETVELLPEDFILFCDTVDVAHLSIMEKKFLFDALQCVTLN